MDDLKLVRPTITHKEQVSDMIEEFDKYQEAIHGGAEIETFARFESWLEYQSRHQDVNTVPDGRVPATVYFLCDETEETIIGIIDIRHELNEFLLREGGHIGYAIRPRGRKKGYGTHLLELGLEKCLELGIEEVLVICDADNLASQRIAEKNFGELEDKYINESGKTLHRYWIKQAKRLIKTL